MKQVTPTFYVAEQLNTADIQALAAQGIEHLICNRPDNEGEGQPLSAEVAEAALAAGLTFDFQPIAPGQFDEAAVNRFAQSVQQKQGKVLAYCRTGTRSISLWALANPEKHSQSELLTIAESAGYNLTALTSRLGA